MALDETSQSPKKEGQKTKRPLQKRNLLRMTGMAIRLFLDPTDIAFDDLFSDMEVSEQISNQEEEK